MYRIASLALLVITIAANLLSAFRRLLKRFYSSSHILISSTDIIQLLLLAVVAPLGPLLKITAHPGSPGKRAVKRVCV